MSNEVKASHTPVIYNKTMTLADTEYSQEIAAGCRKYMIHTRDGATFRMAFETGKVATPTEPYFTVLTGGYLWDDLLDLTDDTLEIYFGCADAGKVIEIIAWFGES